MYSQFTTYGQKEVTSSPLSLNYNYYFSPKSVYPGKTPEYAAKFNAMTKSLPGSGLPFNKDVNSAQKCAFFH